MSIMSIMQVCQLCQLCQLVCFLISFDILDTFDINIRDTELTKNEEKSEGRMAVKLNDFKRLRKVFGRDIVIRVVVTRGEMHLIRVDALDPSHHSDIEEVEEAPEKPMPPIGVPLDRKEIYFG